jgi:hypothetical protein
VTDKNKRDGVSMRMGNSTLENYEKRLAGFMKAIYVKK